jgi:NAD(P)-dependent dehydrogenase (short-subunit alcohol dehydrogenase family)
MSRVWFITGCSTGFGRLLVEKLHAAGDRVVATARSVQALYDLGREDEERILRMPLDVRDGSTIEAAVAAALERFGRIDVLVNNAGYGYFATQEEGELDEIRQMFETNVFGLIATTQAVVPHMRRQGAGTIVNLSSIAGKIATPRGGFYQASKWAVEALSESLYLEESSFGLHVVIIEPGSYETDFGPRSSRVAAAESTGDSPFGALREQWKANASARLFVQRQDPNEVVDGIREAVDCGLPFVRLPIGRDATVVIARRHELGDADFVEWMRGVYHGDAGSR